jgi:hypothetical protein
MTSRTAAQRLREIHDQRSQLDAEQARLEDAVKEEAPGEGAGSYKTPEYASEVSALAVATQKQAIDKARSNALVGAGLAIILPPLVILILGADLGWVLSGFRRKSAAVP